MSALDVLEHLEPAKLLAEARRLLAPGGRLLLSVPAFASLWSEARRARRPPEALPPRSPGSGAAGGGFVPELTTHYQFLLFPLVWLSRQLDARRQRPLERRPPGFVGRLLGAVNALEVSWWGRSSLPWGSSLIALARPLPEGCRPEAAA